VIRIASHRGGAILWPENSLMALRNALALPAEELEIDVHLTADDAVVVLHDATLDRTTDATGPVRAWTQAALRTVRVRGTAGEGVPTLEQAVAMTAAAGRRLRLEIKADAAGRPYLGIVGRCLRILDAQGMRARTVLMSFQPLTIAEAGTHPGWQGLALLIGAGGWRGMGPAGAVALARSCGATELGLPIGECEAGGVAAIRAARLGIGAWGANDIQGMGRAMALGLDVMTTDDPRLALALRDGPMAAEPPAPAAQGAASG
jgi:glycerophosphoryl diester phosphodiesterase